MYPPLIYQDVVHLEVRILARARLALTYTPSYYAAFQKSLRDLNFTLWNVIQHQRNNSTSIWHVSPLLQDKHIHIHRVGSIYIADIYHWYIYRIYIRYFRSKISDIFDIFNFYRVFQIFFNVTHCDYVLTFSLCVLLACALSIFSVLDNFCQIAPLHSNAVWMTRVLHLIRNAHTRILIFGSKFHIILAMYVQMLDIYISKISKKSDIFYIFENITIFSNPAHTCHCPTTAVTVK